MKKLLICCAFIFINMGLLYGNNPINPRDSLLAISRMNDAGLRQKKLMRFVQTYLFAAPLPQLANHKLLLDSLLLRANIKGVAPVLLYSQSIYHKRLLKFDEAEYDILKAIQLAVKSEDHFLLYLFFDQLAFIQTDNGNAIKAIESYKIAKSESLKLDDPFLPAVVDVNIADIYLRSHLYKQSLSYLQQAFNISGHFKKPEFSCFILINKAENYFRLNNLDSLTKCDLMLRALHAGSPRLSFTFLGHANFYVEVLRHDYKAAIIQMNQLFRENLSSDSLTDYQNLAEAYYKNNQIDSAKLILKHLQTSIQSRHFPDLQSEIYEMSGEMALGEHDYKQAANDLEVALIQARKNVNNLSQVNNLSVQMEIDDVERAYNHDAEEYRQQRLVLIFIVLMALFAAILIALLYRSSRQRAYYEKIIFKTKKEELAYINSHEVRRHLTNILGLIEVIRQSQSKHEEYAQAEGQLFYSAEQLDIAIRNISEKLDNLSEKGE